MLLADRFSYWLFALLGKHEETDQNCIGNQIIYVNTTTNFMAVK